MYKAMLALLMVFCLSGCGMRGVVPAAPLYVDPNYGGSCDPEIVWNVEAEEWWIFYTGRRTDESAEGDPNKNTPIGVAASKDWVNWRFVGYLDLDGQVGKKLMANQFAAPGITRDGNTYHMFASVDTSIVHYTAPSDDLIHGWVRSETQPVNSPKTIDATPYRKDGKLHLMYRAEKGHFFERVTEDFVNWSTVEEITGDVSDEVVRGYAYQEASYVFWWKGYWWLVVDPHKGFAVFRSRDATNWRMQDRILEEPGVRKYDGTRARHCSVAVVDGRAFMFYHVEPGRDYEIKRMKNPKKDLKAFVQIVELGFEKGDLVVDRDRDVQLPEKAIRRGPDLGGEWK